MRTALSPVVLGVHQAQAGILRQKPVLYLEWDNNPQALGRIGPEKRRYNHAISRHCASHARYNGLAGINALFSRTSAQVMGKAWPESNNWRDHTGRAFLDEIQAAIKRVPAVGDSAVETINYKACTVSMALFIWASKSEGDQSTETSGDTPFPSNRRPFHDKYAPIGSISM